MERSTRTARRQSRIAVRRLMAMLALAACAQPGVPPGGPADVAPPKLVRVRPDSSARNVRGSSITFEFDEVVSERPMGGQSLADAFLISPSTGDPSVSWRRTTIIVTPKGGLRPNTTYTVRLRPGITDLANNVDSAGRVVVFSTGPELASATIAGTVFDWLAARPLPGAYVEAISLPDSARYATTADSLGVFRLSNMPTGRYLARAIADQNRNRVLDTRELFDSLTITLQDSLRREMLAAVRDSLGPGLANVELRDSLSLRVTLDRPLDTAFVATPALFTLKSSDSAAVAIRTVLTERDVQRMAEDSARTRQVQDSVREAARQDSSRRADSARAGVAPAGGGGRPTGRRPGAVTAPPVVAGRGGATRPEPRPTARIPTTALVLTLERPLAAGATYRLRASELRSVTGATRSSERVFTTRPRAAAAPAAKRDTGRVFRD